MKAETLVEIRRKPSFLSGAEKKLAQEIEEFLGIHIDGVVEAQVYHIGKKLTPQELEELTHSVLCDPVTEEAADCESPPPGTSWMVEVAPKTGVTDNLGQTAQIAVEDLRREPFAPAEYVRSARRYYFSGQIDRGQVECIGRELLGNPLIETLNVDFFGDLDDKAVEIIDLSGGDQHLMEISRKKQLALSLEEMQAIRHYFQRPGVVAARKVRNLPPSPTDAELEALAQTWSEHCKHKIFNARIRYRDDQGETIIDSIFKTYIQGATEQLKEKIDWLVSVFSDNAGIIRFNDQYNAVFKVETHNSPSALDPYGGALTGILGVNRDSMGTGIGARLVANTDVFCLAPPTYDQPLPERLLHPRRVLQGVRKGVEDGGNKSGIPTVNGCLVFDNRYLGKPLVYCGTVGIMPAFIGSQATHEKAIYPDDLIVIVGGRTGKDGIHGATFSSEELHRDSPSTAVQIGDPFTQKKVHDFLLEARDRLLYRTLTDNGAGGFSSSVGEMAELSGGCEIHLEKAPLKYPGLQPWEILLSESQERMTLAVPPENFAALKRLAKVHDVEISSIGHFTNTGYFHVTYEDRQVAWLDLQFLHGGVPQLDLEAEWTAAREESLNSEDLPEDFSIERTVLQLLGRPNICSKESIIRQYDHEVQGGTYVKPITGPGDGGPSDAAVIKPLEAMNPSKLCPEGLVVSNGICPRFSDFDAGLMAWNALDEAIRNAVAVGANPSTIALLDNFCWPDPIYHPEKNPDGKHKLAQLVRAGKALYEGALAYGTPYISGKDSMKNDYRIGDVKISVPPTLLISALGRIEDTTKAVTADFKQAGHLIYVLGITRGELGGSEFAAQLELNRGIPPTVVPETAHKLYTKLHEAIRTELVASCHDCSDGGLVVAIAESAFGGSLGAQINLCNVSVEHDLQDWEILFSESASRFVVTVPEAKKGAFEETMGSCVHSCIGKTQPERVLVVQGLTEETIINLELSKLREAWTRTVINTF